uniref:Retrotransposon gag domain-containing protein n=1 Tax=Cucumis melo TaxID=3656 RepID=A0A9I9D4C6_CUCME
MKKLMKEQFLLPNYEQTLNNQYQNHRQGLKTGTDYIEEFHRLGARTNSMESEQRLIARSVGALHMDIKETVRLQPFSWLSEASSFAETVEEMGWLSEASSFAETVEEMNEIRSKKATKKGLWGTSLNKAYAPHTTTNQPPAAKEKDQKKAEERSEKKEDLDPKKKARNPYN